MTSHQSEDGDHVLRESADRWRQMFERNAAVMLLIDPQTMAIVDANPAACAFYGYTHEALTALTIADVNMLARADVAAEAQRAAARERGYFNFRHRLANGEIRAVEVYSGPVQAGSRRLLCSIVHDITPLKHAEEQLRRQLEFTAAITASLGEGVIALDGAGRLIFMNPAAEQMVGWTVGDLDGQEWHERVHAPRPDGSRLPASACPTLGVLRTGVAAVVDDDFFTHRDGTMFPVAYTAAPIAGDGRVAGVVLVFRDTTAQRRSASRLRESEASYRLLFEANPQAMWVYDSETFRFLAVNDAALARYGYTRAEFLAMTLLDVRPPDDRPRVRALLTESPARPESLGVWRHQTKSGHILWVEVSTHPILFEGRRARLALTVDITERKRAEEALRASEERYRELVENANDIIYTHDFAGNFTSVNYAGLRAFELSLEELLQLNITEVIDPAYLSVARDNIFRKLREVERTAPYELLAHTMSGRPIWLEISSRVLFEQGARVGVQGIARDITGRKRVEEQLRLQAAALESAANAIMMTDRGGVITWVNPAFTRLTGYTAVEALTRNPRILNSGQQDAAFYATLWRTILAGEVWHGELINRRKNGTFYTEEQTITPVRDDRGTITHFIAVKQDVTERKQHEAQLTHLASHDALTNLPNRRSLADHLERAVVRARCGAPGALLFLDLDNFKLVNDMLGHAAGDELLVTLSALLARQLRPEDLLARLGGDEFAVLLESTTLGDACRIGERLREAVETAHFTLEGHGFDLGLSIGLVPIDGRLSAQVLLAQADIAMYTAKDLGRNRLMVYRPGDASVQQLSEANQWVRRIKDALRSDRLLLYFQPVRRLPGGDVVHYEALIRMRDDTGGLVLPGTFIPAAERFGLMPVLDRWIVQQVVRCLQTRPDIRLYMNLSARSLADEALLDFIEAELQTAVVAPSRLGFEITETAAVQDLARAERWIRRVKALGCGVALDDFGAGFTSFAYLRSLPVDQIKIDGSFIRTLDVDPASRDIVRALHTLARALGKETVAESVENAAAVSTLEEIGVPYAQGYYLGKPAPRPA